MSLSINLYFKQDFQAFYLLIHQIGAQLLRDGNIPLFCVTDQKHVSLFMSIETTWGTLCFRSKRGEIVQVNKRRFEKECSGYAYFRVCQYDIYCIRVIIVQNGPI